MESWGVIVLGRGPAALRAAISAADAGGSPIIIDGGSIGSGSGTAPLSGLAASVSETSPALHIEDTISMGGETTDKEAAARICDQAVATLAELERWGLVLRRDDSELPHLSGVEGHSVPRLAGCGDSTTREVTRILEEQAIKRGVTRRSDMLPISLVMDNNQTRGIVALDIESGNVIGIQAKAVILATDGYQGLWSDPANGAGTGAAISAGSGISLKGMENVPMHALTVSGTDLSIPMGVLGSGGRIRMETGEDTDSEAVLSGESCVLDLRAMGRESSEWFSQTASRVRDRAGLDISSEVLPLSPSVSATTGGVPVDENGRAVFKEGKMWYTGLYAAGRSCHTGMHGSRPLPGNVLLEDIVTGKAAGSHAATWASNASFGGAEEVSSAEMAAKNKVDSMFGSEGSPVGQVTRALSSAMSNIDGTGEESAMAVAMAGINEISNAGIRVTDPSRSMNTELVSAIHLDGLLTIAKNIADS
ncbi:MAG: hypothetical protein CMB22_03930 [Euryarchaeota archaeon]|nr:hypothetical protein [Euryarchaeota archaeon]|tara:strand:+ start:3828 stop:5258 length:1431 start_codon:yes stop_codon:yes gene_type:complete